MGLHVVAITGASGARYERRLIEALTSAGHEVRLIVSNEGGINLDLECGINAEQLAERYGCILEGNRNLAAKSASGQQISIQ